MKALDPENPPEEVRHKIIAWENSIKRPGRPSCPCGFVGGSRNICQHRSYCNMWRAYAYKHRWPATQPNKPTP